MRCAVTGATGLLGRRVVAALARRGDDVVALSRRPASVAGRATTVWDPAAGALAPSVRDGLDAVVNLAGTPIAGRWSAAHRAAIRTSRRTVTRRVVEALAHGPPAVLVSGSAVGYYGPTEAPVDEGAPPGRDFLASVCAAWEAEARRHAGAGRLVLVRTGVVLAPEGGAFPPIRRLGRLGLGGPLGRGTQWLPWIHVDDAVAALVRALDDDALAGPVNLVAPEAVRQGPFAAALGRVLHRPAVVPTPAVALRLALGGSAALALTGQHVVPRVLADHGFPYAHPDLEGALRQLLGAPWP